MQSISKEETARGVKNPVTITEHWFVSPINFKPNKLLSAVCPISDKLIIQSECRYLRGLGTNKADCQSTWF